MRKRPPYSLTSVDNALRLIELLRDQGRVRLSDVADELGIGRSTAHRLLTMLTYRDFAIQDESRGYLPGPALTAPSLLGGTAFQQFRRALTPYMDGLCERTGETVNLMVRMGKETRFLGCSESQQLLHVGDRQGTILPAHESSGGKALLALLDDDQVRRIYSGDERSSDVRAPLDERDLRRLLAELATVRRRGYALNMQATEIGVCAIGRTVRAGHLDLVGAVSISVPSLRFPRDRIPTLAEALRQMTAEAERDLGG